MKFLNSTLMYLIIGAFIVSTSYAEEIKVKTNFLCHANQPLSLTLEEKVRPTFGKSIYSLEVQGLHDGQIEVFELPLQEIGGKSEQHGCLTIITRSYRISTRVVSGVLKTVQSFTNGVPRCLGMNSFHATLNTSTHKDDPIMGLDIAGEINCQSFK